MKMMVMVMMMMIVMVIIDDDNDSNDDGDWVLDKLSAMRFINPCKSGPPRTNVKKNISFIHAKFIIKRFAAARATLRT